MRQKREKRWIMHRAPVITLCNDRGNNGALTAALCFRRNGNEEDAMQREAKTAIFARFRNLGATKSRRPRSQKDWLRNRRDAIRQRGSFELG